eukprot:jgi/Chlat1/8498/Chrsp80S07888
MGIMPPPPPQPSGGRPISRGGSSGALGSVVNASTTSTSYGNTGNTTTAQQQAAPPPRAIRFRSSLHNTVADVMRGRGWSETDAELEWDVFWADVGWVHEALDHVHLADHQRINHFRNHYELTRKDLLIKNLKRAAKKQLQQQQQQQQQNQSSSNNNDNSSALMLGSGRYDFFPQSYALPAEYGIFVEEFKKVPPGTVWIMKPVGRAQGKGIFLFNKLSQISDWKKDHRWGRNGADQQQYQQQLQQQQRAGLNPDEDQPKKYINNPYLLGGKKFDMRIYVMVASYAPLRAYLYRSGFARFSNARFSMRKEDIVNNYIHLTNFAIQKTAPVYDPKIGTKWMLHSLRQHLASRHGAAAANDAFAEMQSLIVRSLLAVAPVIIQDKHCFEVYGYDIMLDDNLKPWLLEVNASPSLSADTPADYELKCAMLDDAFTIVDVERRLPAHLPDQIGGWDLIWDHGPVVRGDRHTSLACMLGCHNDRVKNLKKLFMPRKQ